MESSITKDDAVITAYRAHGWTYVRGVAPHAILGELTGRNIAVPSMRWRVNCMPWKCDLHCSDRRIEMFQFSLPDLFSLSLFWFSFWDFFSKFDIFFSVLMIFFNFGLKFNHLHSYWCTSIILKSSLPVFYLNKVTNHN